MLCLQSAVCPDTREWHVTRTYEKAGETVRAGTCTPCVGAHSIQRNTMSSAGEVCYKSLQSASGDRCGECALASAGSPGYPTL